MNTITTIEQQILIQGERELSGSIHVSAAKNAVLPIMACSLLTEEPLIIKNAPNLSDTKAGENLLQSPGVSVEHPGSLQANKKPHKTEKDSKSTNSSEVDNEYPIKLTSSENISHQPSVEASKKFRASIWLLGPLLAKKGVAKLTLPGGCKIGERKIDLHLALLHKMGAHIEENGSTLIASTSGEKLKACHYKFPSISVGATINGILASCLAEGETILENTAVEPEILDLCTCLQNMGAKIEWIGNRKLKITGVENLHGTTHKVMFDRIEAGSYILAAAATNSNLEINGIDVNYMQNILEGCREIGIDYEISGDKLYVKKHNQRLTPYHITTEPYPGFPTDMQAQFTSLLSVVPGLSRITENIFENRFQHIKELNKMGANISVKDKTALVIGTPALFGTKVTASDLRASKALVIAALMAKGETRITGIEHLERGYVDIVAKLGACGANIERVRYTETAQTAELL